MISKTLAHIPIVAKAMHEVDGGIRKSSVGSAGGSSVMSMSTFMTAIFQG